MKKNLLLTATLAAAGIAYYFVCKKRLSRAGDPFNPVIRSHHITDVFAKAKEQAVK